MEWRGRRQSGNVRRGGSGGGGGGAMIPVGGGGMVLLLILFLIFGGNPGDLIQGSSAVYEQSQSQSSEPAQVTNELEEFLSVVLADTEDVWHEIFQEAGGKYREPTMYLYSGQTSTACGIGNSQMGPFYCPGDEGIYIDPDFYYELSNNFGAPGDFAFAYVLAHEVGHHVQKLTGVTDQVFALQGRVSEQDFNKQLVRLELQADYLAGVFAKHVENKGYLEAGDIGEAMDAAAAVGDDTIQEKHWGRVVPDKFTHGTAEQRQRWFNRGYQYGDLNHGDSFSVPENQL